MTIALSFCFFVMLMVVVGNISARRKRKHTAEDYLLAGRIHGRFAVALSAASSAVSGFIMIGAVGAGYTMGVVALMMPLGWFFGDLVFWSLFPDQINRRARDHHYNTVPEFISKNAALGARSSGSKNPGEAVAAPVNQRTVESRISLVRKYLAIAIIILVGGYAVGQYLAVGKAVSVVFDISMPAAVILSGVVILAYSAKGGLESSIPTQFFQALIMLTTTLGMLSVATWLGGGPAQLMDALQSTHPELLSFKVGESWWLSLLFFAGFAGAAFAFNMGTPNLLVRIMAARSPEEAVKSRWVYMGFMQATWLSMSLFGLLMNVFFPDIADPEQALPVFSQEYLHPLISGAVMAGIFASVASTLDGQVLVVSSSFAVDVSPGFYRRMTRRFGLRYQSMVTIFVSCAVGTVAILLKDSTNVFDIIVISASAMGGTVGLAFFITLMRWRTSVPALLTGLAAAILTALAWRHYGLTQYVLEAAPSFIAGLVTHQFIIKSRANQGQIKEARLD